MAVFGEVAFDVVYLCFALVAGAWMIAKGKTKLARKAGVMAVVLGAGDAFHLVPRCVALLGSGLENNVAALGVGKMVTSVTMTVFYLILFDIWRDYYRPADQKKWAKILGVLAGVRVALCLLPQNQWMSANPPYLWNILRNVPFTAMGLVIIWLFARETKRTGDRTLRHAALAVTLSFAFYAPVVLFVHLVPVIGMLMIPKTLAYVWIIVMCMKIKK